MSASEKATFADRLIELKRGWRVIIGCAAALIFGTHAIPFYTSGIFIGALHSEFSWSLLSLSFGPTLFVIGLAASAPIVGILCDKFGERRLILSGLFFYVLGCLLLRVRTH